MPKQSAGNSTPSSSVDLPKPIAAYFALDKGDSEALARCFTEEAVVIDEGVARHGRAAIKLWKENAAITYQYTSEPFACERAGEKFVVTSRVVGNFPGSPVNLRYFFQLAHDKIAGLEIVI
jgi:hypothetical protein